MIKLEKDYLANLIKEMENNDSELTHIFRNNLGVLHKVNCLKYGNDDLDIDVSELNETEIISLKSVGYNIITNDSYINSLMPKKSVKCFYNIFEEYNINSIVEYLKRIRNEIKSNNKNVIIFSFKDKTDDKFYGQSFPFDKTLWKMLNDFKISNRLDEDCIITDEDLSLDLTSYIYKDLIKIVTYDILENEQIEYIHKCQLNLFNQSLKKMGNKIIVPEKVDLNNDTEVTVELTKSDLSFLAYVSLSNKIVFEFETKKYYSDFINLCTIFFSRQIYPDRYLREFVRDINGQNVVTLNNSSPSAISKVKTKVITTIVPAVNFNICLAKYQTETIIASIEPEEIPLEIDDKLYSLELILESTFSTFKENVKETSDTKLRSEIKSTKNEEDRDNIYLQYLILRLLDIARRCLKNDLVAVTELTFKVYNDKLYMFCMPEQLKTVSCVIHDLEPRKEQEDEYSVVKDVEITNILPTYIFDNWTGLKYEETKIGIETLTEVELKKFIERYSITNYYAEFCRLRIEKRYKELMFFGNRGYTDEESRLYKRILAADNNFEKIVMVDIQGKIVSVFNYKSLT